ncbi:MAG: dynamin family protein [Phocaeicola sp.]
MKGHNKKNYREYKVLCGNKQPISSSSTSKTVVKVNTTARKEQDLLVTTNNVSSNEFINYRQKVIKAIEEYEKLPSTRKEEGGFYRTIKRKASPFINGHFTLAIVGKMSAGKSTFINALLGCRDLLPTGHFQTTCVLTKIEHSAEKSIEVSFGDGHKETIKSEVSGKLEKLVAIETEYSSLPVNDINKLIVKGWRKDKICKAEIIKGMEETSRRKIDKIILEKYINSHPKSKIATEVTIKYPLPEDCQGWRIVDTPGVEAVGGIDVETTEFLTAKNEFGGNNVDAIIILHKGSDNIEDKSINDFVKDIYTPLSDEAKKRLFFVVTNASDEKFQDNEEEYMKKAKALFVDEFNIKNNRLIAVDSLMEVLYRYVRDNHKDIVSMMTSKEVPDGSWTPSIWKSCRSLLKDIRDTLEDEDKNVNNETMLAMVQGWSNFGPLRLIINTFVKSEKTNAFNDLIHTIRDDINQSVDYRKNDVTLLQKGIKEMQGQIELLSRTELEINETLGEIYRKFDKEAVKARFDFIESKIKNEIEADDASYKDIRREAANLYDLADEKKKSLFLEIKLVFSKYIQVGQSKVFFNRPDFDEMERESTDKATELNAKTMTRRIPGSCCDDYEEYTENVAEINQTKKLEAFRTMSCRHIRTESNKFKAEIQHEVDSYVALVSNSLKLSLKSQKKHLDELMSRYKVSSDQELKGHEKTILSEISVLNNYLNSISTY